MMMTTCIPMIMLCDCITTMPLAAVDDGAAQRRQRYSTLPSTALSLLFDWSKHTFCLLSLWVRRTSYIVPETKFFRRSRCLFYLPVEQVLSLVSWFSIRTIWVFSTAEAKTSLYGNFICLSKQQEWKWCCAWWCDSGSRYCCCYILSIDLLAPSFKTGVSSMDLEYVIADVRHDLTEHFSSLVRSDATKVRVSFQTCVSAIDLVNTWSDRVASQVLADIDSGKGFVASLMVAIKRGGRTASTELFGFQFCSFSWMQGCFWQDCLAIFHA